MLNIAATAQSNIPRIQMGRDRKELDPRGGFVSAGDYFYAVRKAFMHGAHMRDERLDLLAASPATYGSEGTGTDGGFAVPIAFANEVFTHSLSEGALLPFVDVIPIQTNVLGLPVDETTPWGSDGIQSYWITEGQTLTATKPKVRETMLRLAKLAVLVPLSDELLADSAALGAYLPKRAGDRIRWGINDAILFGLGSGRPLGAFTGVGVTGSAAITIAKEAGQAVNTVAIQNLAKMYTTLPQGSHTRAVWLIQPDTLALAISIGASAFPMTAPLPEYPGSAGTLFGRPVFASQHCAALSSAGDIILVDLAYYTAIV
ncbi:MAG TPA: phage major capsid protein, partial [Casimicrobiaceae bacterium]|nr:phage major capsid protein [Casimicrobiaceae bacterium]